MSPQYGECDYWDQRYLREPSTFEWYQGFAGLAYVLRQSFPLKSSILQVGVGSSRVQEDMVRAGWEHIVNVDYSKVAIAHMKDMHKEIPELEYYVADVRAMPEFAEGSFDGVLDKGTMDAILCGSDSTSNAMAMLIECHRVLKPGRAMVIVTYGDPASRLTYLEELDWVVQVYCLTKREVLDEEQAADRKEPVMRMLLKGPYPASNVDCMDALSGLENMHFVYVCRKPETEACATPEPEEAALEPGASAEGGAS